MFGVPTLLTFYLNTENTRNYKIFFLALNLSHLVHFIINISLLSRGMIFNTLSNILGYIKSNQNAKFIKILVSTLFLLILFFSSIHFVSLKRDKIYEHAGAGKTSANDCKEIEQCQPERKRAPQVKRLRAARRTHVTTR